MIQLIFYSLIGGLFSLAGGLILLTKAAWAKKTILSLLAFAAGAFLGATFLDILPEALEAGVEPHYILIATLVGFILFFMLERLLIHFHPAHRNPAEEAHHVHSEHTESLPLLIVIGDSIHNFLDGVIIAIAYIANPVLGLTTALGVAAHEIPQEIADFSVLLDQGWSKWRIVVVNIFQSLLTIPGVILGYYLGNVLNEYLPYLLGATAGIFLYIAASDLIPEIHHRMRRGHFLKVTAPLILGVLVVGYLIHLAH